MEYLTNSSGVTVILNQCQHVPSRTVLVRSNSANGGAFPSLNNIIKHQRSPNVGLAYGKSMIMPAAESPMRSSSVLGGYLGSAKRRVAVPRYDSINDPHLRDYFERKFKLSSAKKKKFTHRKPGPNECIYKIRVKTGNQISASTDANVYITIFGYHFNLARTRLFNKHDAIRLGPNNFKYRFERNSTNTFKIVGVDVGQISHIIIEHDGKEALSSWFLQEVLITHSKSKRSWLFECNDWLSLDHGLHKIRVRLTPTKQLESYTETDYEIVVVTGDKKFAGTDANVFITLFGPRNKSTSKLELPKNRSNNRNPFETGSTDIFKLTNINYVGPIHKVRIEHDNSGLGPGWFLERIVVTDLKDPKVKYYCPCSKWLAKDMDDGQISRDLLANNNLFNIQKIGKYRITVFTSNKRGAGTDADVTIILYGSIGDSGEWKLDDKKNNFERGMKDEFEIECPCIGEMEKIKIGHNNKGIGAGWHLNKVIIDDLEKHRVYEFIADRWLAEDEADGKTSVFLYPSNGNSKSDAGVPYNIRVFTGDDRNAGTSAKVFIEMFGERSNESSGRMDLSDGRFDRGMIDQLVVISKKSLSPLSEILIGHDNSGFGPGWFLDRVEIECPHTGITQVFPCEKWLAKDEMDGRIERYLKENTSLRQHKKSEAIWNVWVHTSDMKYAGTDANVYIQIYGDEGKTDEIQLNNKSDNFESGHVDEFKIETAKIGIPFKMRVWHDDKGAASGWHLDKIELENVKTKDQYVFYCNRWLSKDEDDKEIVREMPAEGATVRKVLPLVNYTVEVHTGKKMGAGTDANVFLNIFGDYGDTGDRILSHSKTHRNKFERDQIDEFNIEAVTLKNLNKIRIGHDGKGAGDGWFLKQVVVKQDGNSKYDQTFTCDRWLATDEDDGKIVREFLVNGSDMLDKNSYHVRIKTGNVSGAGTDANVSLKIFGRKGDTGNQVLRNAENKYNKFEKGQVDEFDIENEDIGKIEKIRIGHDGKGFGSGWFLDYVEIDVPSKGSRYMFSAHRWLDENEDDRQTTIELFPTEVKKIRKYIPYVVTTRTGKKRGAGTDANVFIQIYGADGKTEEISLDNKTNNFESGQEDVFKIEADDVGPIYKVRIGHDDSNPGSAWYLESLRLQRNDTKSKRSLSGRDDIDESFFLVNRWFAKNQDDGQIVREIVPTDENGRPLVVLEEIPYEVKVFTGSKSGAGTDANVFMTIYGQQGDSGERELRKSDHSNKFERDQVDTFKVKAVELGELEKIKIGHDNSGFMGSAWYLEKIEIFNPRTQRTYLFNCQNWLAKNVGDGKTTRELPAIDPEMLRRVKFRAGATELKDQILLETEALTVTYNVTVVTSDISGAGTDANVHIQLYGEKNDSGRHFLKNSRTNRNKFERGQTDVFEVKTSDVGDLRKIKIGHDGFGIGDGWHLKEVIIDAPKLGKRWKFPCNRWLDKSEDDGKIERSLEPLEISNQEYVPHVMYEVDVYTSNLRNADTTANPYIVIYGEDTKTQKTNLCRNQAERKDKFKRGAIDRFCLELDDVGDYISKIRIGHDDEGMFSGWHVDKVEIRRLKRNSKGSNIYVFPCNRWLARDEGDRAIECDLVVSKVIDEKRSGESREREVRNKLEMKNYVVEVFTGKVSRAGTNANVYLTLFGDFGDTGEKQLNKSETHMDKFESGQRDRFIIQSADLGKIFKCIIRHDNSGLSADWYLNKIEVIDGRDVYEFICERWLSKSKEDKKIERTLFEKNYKGPRSTSSAALSLSSKVGGSTLAGSQSKLSLRNQSPFDRNNAYPSVPYQITIRTGDEPNCGNSAQVFIRLLGSHKKQDTGRINLQLAKSRRFKPGSAEVFQIETMDVGEIREIELGHDGVGRDCNWFVKNIEIKDPVTGFIYDISCNAWLSTEKKDGLTVRTFKVGDAMTKITSTEGIVPYYLSIQTGDIEKAGTDSNVTLKFFGSKGTSSEVRVEKMDDRFERATNTEIPIDIEDIGALKKVRVSIDARGYRKEWFLNCIEMTNMNTRKQYLFVAEEWLSKSKEGSRGLSIDVPLFKGGQETIQKTDYRISVKTSNLSGAGTDSNVFVVLFGQNGDSGELQLKNSETNMNKFEKNRTDVFLFKGLLSLGELVKLRVWHDNSGSFIGNSNWHLENIVVEDLKENRVFNFKCNKWLSKSKDDKQVVRELKPDDAGDTSRAGTPRAGERTNYEITVMTSDEPGAGTRQNAFVVLIGENGSESKPIYIENTNRESVLRRGHADVVKFSSRSVGPIKKILLGHQSKPGDIPKTSEERGAPWICSEVNVVDLGTDTTYIFSVRDALIRDQRPKMFRLDRKKESMVSKSKNLNEVKYEVTVVTGNDKSAGTTSNASITLYGKNGDSGKRPLKKGFSRQDVDKFTVECIDLGELRKINIEHDNSGLRKHWLVDRVEVLDPLTNRKYIFPCEKWLSKSKEDGEISRDLFPLADERSVSRGSKSPRGSSRDFERDFERSFKSNFDRDINSTRGSARNLERDLIKGLEKEMDRGRGRDRDFDRPIRSTFDRVSKSPRGSSRDFDRDFDRPIRSTFDRASKSPRGSSRDFDRDFDRDMGSARGRDRDFDKPIKSTFDREFQSGRPVSRNFEREFNSPRGMPDMSRGFGSSRGQFDQSPSFDRGYPSRGFEREMMRR